MKIKEQPVVLEDPKTQVYLPVATTKTKGIASYDPEDFNVDPNGKVSLNEDLHQIKENSDSALENSQEAKETADSAKETAEEALQQVVEGQGTKIYENGVPQTSVNVDSDIQEQFDQLTEEVEGIQELVPNQASAQNQLADKNFVNSSINAIAAFYITYDSQGNPFPTKAALSSATTFYSGGETRVPTRNDYCLVLADETHDNASCRYVYSGEYPNGQWDFQFIVNESPFTSDQVAAINSGITSALVQQIPNKADLNNPNQSITTGNLTTKKLQIKTGAIEFDDSSNTFWTGSNLNIGGNLTVDGNIINNKMDYQLDQTITVTDQSKIFIPVDFNKYDYKLVMLLAPNQTEHNTSMRVAIDGDIINSMDRWMYNGIQTQTPNSNFDLTGYTHSTSSNGYMYLCDNGNAVGRHTNINLEITWQRNTDATLVCQGKSTRTHGTSFGQWDIAGIVYNENRLFPNQLVVTSANMADTNLLNGYIRVYKRLAFGQTE